MDLYQAPNRIHNFRVSFYPGKHKIELRDKKSYEHDWSYTIGLESYSKGPVLNKPRAHKSIRADYRKLVSVHENVIIDYNNSEDGVRQNFLITNPPKGQEKLVLHLSINLLNLSPQLNEGGTIIEFYSVMNGDRVATYSDLNVFDNNGVKLNSSFVQSENGEFFIVVDDSNAAYPVLVDPLSRGDSVSGSSNSEFGFSITSVTGSGGDDKGILIGAPKYDGGQTNEGSVYYFLDLNLVGDIVGSTAAWSYESNSAYALLGYDVCGKGDFNDDDDYDIAVGAPGYSSDTGRVYLWEADSHFASSPVTIDGSVSNGKFGWSVSASGDVDNDGYDDLLLGAPLENGTNYYLGTAYLFDGQSSGLVDTYSSWSYTAPDDTTNGYGIFGAEVAIVASINNDSYGDVVVGAPDYNSNEGLVRVFNGSSSGPSSSVSQTLYGGSGSPRFGFSISGGGSVNNDSYNDIVIGAPQYSNGQSNEGGIFVFHGSTSGLSTSYDWKGESDQASAKLGHSVDLRDWDEDTYYDVCAGAPYYDPTSVTNGGRAVVWNGSSSGINSGTNGTGSNEDENILGLTSNGNLGYSVTFFIFSLHSGVAVGIPGLDDVALYD